MNIVTVTLKDMSSKDLSHELNISLTGIKGGIELLDISGLSKDQQEQLKVIQESEDRLEKVIHKILSSAVEDVHSDDASPNRMIKNFLRLVIR